MKVDRTTARLFRVQIYFPQLAQRVGLDEVALVVYVEAVVDRVALQVGDKAGNIDDCHVSLSAQNSAVVVDVGCS